MRKIVHISDLHFGRVEPERVTALQEAIGALLPDVLVVSGDLTQRARSREFRAAAAFLGGFLCPKVVVPGNHDIPLYNLFARLTQPFTKYAKHIGADREPLFEDDEILVAGVSTVQPYRWKDGHMGADSLARSCSRLESAQSKIKIVVSHHPLDLFDDGSGRRLLAAAPDILLAGHLHASSARATAKLNPSAHRSTILVQAGTSTSTRLREEGNAFNLMEVSRDTVVVVRYTSSSSERRFQASAPQTFQSTASGWHPGTTSATP